MLSRKVNRLGCPWKDHLLKERILRTAKGSEQRARRKQGRNFSKSLKGLVLARGCRRAGSRRRRRYLSKGLKGLMLARGCRGWGDGQGDAEGDT